MGTAARLLVVIYVSDYRRTPETADSQPCKPDSNHIHAEAY